MKLITFADEFPRNARVPSYFRAPKKAISGLRL